MSTSLNGLTLVGFLVATVLIGIASTLDAHSRWSNMSEQVRRFVDAEWRELSTRDRPR